MNYIKHLLLLLVLTLGSTLATSAQESLTTKFEQRIVRGVPQGATSSRDKKQDRNGDYAAIVRVNAANIQNYVFDSQYLLKAETRIDSERNEATLFFSPNHQRTSLRLTLKGSEAASISVDLGSLESLFIYDLAVKVNRDKSRTLVMPMVNVGGTMNYGIMLSVAKKMGPYLKFNYDFQGISDEGECTNAGNIVGSEEWPYYSGETTKSRMAITGGLLLRLWQGNLASGSDTQGLYTYVGGGYGYANYYWKTTDERWLRNADLSYQGVEVELGLLYRYKALALSAGFQCNSFKYGEASVGVGIMF